MKLALGIAIALAVTLDAFAVALAQNGLVGGIGTGEYVSGGSGGAPPPGSNDLLLVDGTSYLLQTDATSKICLASGC